MYELVIFAVIVANSICIGIQVQVAAEDPTKDVLWLDAIGHAFTFVFLFELLLRMYSDGLARFYWPVSFWPWFDTLIVAAGLLDFCMQLFIPGTDVDAANWRALR